MTLRICPARFTIEFRDGLFLIGADQPLFSTEPFLAVQEKGGLFYRDNPTREDERLWAYRPRRAGDVEKIGVAGANTAGRTGVRSLTISA